MYDGLRKKEHEVKKDAASRAAKINGKMDDDDGEKNIKRNIFQRQILE